MLAELGTQLEVPAPGPQVAVVGEGPRRSRRCSCGSWDPKEQQVAFLSATWVAWRYVAAAAPQNSGTAVSATIIIVPALRQA